MNIVLRQVKPQVIRAFNDREWEKNVVEGELSKYLNYYIAKNPKQMTKYKPEIHSAKDIIDPESLLFKRALEKCMQNNRKEDCEEAFSHVYSRFFKDKEGCF